MKKINIVVGTYGYRKNDTSAVELIDKNSGPIEVSDAEAKRLIGLKIAVAAETKTATQTPTPAPAPEPNGTEEPAPVAPMVTGRLDAESLKEYSYKALQSLAKKLGLSTKGKTEELIERIAATEVQAPAEDEEGTKNNVPGTDDEEADNEKPPVLNAVDPE